MIRTKDLKIIVNFDTYYNTIFKKIIPVEVDSNNPHLLRSHALFNHALNSDKDSSEESINIQKCCDGIARVAQKYNYTFTFDPDVFIKKVIDEKRGEQNEIN